MRRAICSCEPIYARAGNINTWKFIYSPSNDLPKGTKIKFDLQTTGRNIDWEIPQTDMKKKSNLIWGVLPNEKTITALAVAQEDSYIPYFEFTLPIDISVGSSFTIMIGTPNKTAEKDGTRCQCFSQRRKAFNIYVNTKGKSEYKDPDLFQMDIRGNSFVNLKIITPSLVERNKRFDIIARFEDEYGNLTNYAPENTLIELSYQNLRENLNWKLFVPETGFLALPNLYFNEAGTDRIKMKNLQNNQVFFSAPILCCQESPVALYWGLLHGEAISYDGTNQIEQCIRQFRDEKAMQFFASSCFDDEAETSSDDWKKITQSIIDFNEEDRFTSFLGLQWIGVPHEEGVRQLIFSKDSKPLLRKKDLKYNNLKKIYKTFQSKDLLSVLSFTMGKECPFNFKDYNPQFERIAEIYNAWGSSEMTKKQGNLRPIMTEKNIAMESSEGSLQEALNNNCRFGFVAGGLDDRGIYGSFYDTDQKQYTPGVTAILAKNHSRDALFEALYQRSCYATTGEHILVGLYLAQKPMGTELDTISKPGLVFNRYLTGYVIGTAPIEKISIIRNGQEIKTFNPKSDELHFDFDDTEPFAKTSINLSGQPPFIYYYLRAEQSNGHIAWSSPIWVDYFSSEKDYKIYKAAKKR